MKVAGGAAGPPTDPFPCWGHTPTFPVVGPLGWHRRCDAAASSPGLPSSGVSTAGMCHLSPPVFSHKEMCTWWGGACCRVLCCRPGNSGSCCYLP